MTPPAPRLSVIVPVLHEAAAIVAAVDALFREAGPLPVEVVVVDGDAEGSTLAALRDERVRRITAPKGRGSQLRAGAEAARGSILLFLHADTRLPAGAFGDVFSAVEGGAEAGAFTLSIDAPGAAFRLVEAGAALRCRLFSLPYGDQAIFVTSRRYASAGGFPPWPLLEDVELVRRLKRSGCAVAVLPARVRTSARRWRRDGVLRRTLGNLAILLLFRLGVSPERLAGMYR